MLSFSIFGSFLYDLKESNTYAAALGKYLLTVYDEDYEWLPELCEVNLNAQRKGVVKEKATTDRIQMLLYPNPVTDILTVSLSGREITNADIEITDLSGRIVMKEKTQKDRTEINVSLLKQGFYVLKVTTSGKVLSKPLIISK
jgi:hypothetical protein